jgi:hypothetical protein
MSRITPSDPIEVNIGACLCAGTPHPDGDLVFLAPHLSLDGGLAATQTIVAHRDQPDELVVLLSHVFLRYGILDWNFTDDDGEPIPVTPTTIAAALPFSRGGLLVANRLFDLYMNEVEEDPLPERPARSSKRGRTAASTSANRPSSSNTPTS